MDGGVFGGVVAGIDRRGEGTVNDTMSGRGDLKVAGTVDGSGKAQDRNQ